MDFTYRKPSHLFAVLLVMLSIFVFVILPIVSFFGVMSSDSATGQLPQFPNEYAVYMEVIILLLQIVFVIFLFILVPVIWYTLVNQFSFKEMFYRLRLQVKGIDKAILWGIVTATAAYVVTIGITLSLQFFGVNVEDAGNIKDLELYFSIPSILLLSTFQPIAEEIFFRGFLLEKLSARYGNTVSIVVTSMFFGLAHLLQGNVIPAILTGMIGILLAYVVVKTNNLYSAIIAHMLFNVTSVILYIVGKTYLTGALML